MQAWPLFLALSYLVHIFLARKRARRSPMKATWSVSGPASGHEGRSRQAPGVSGLTRTADVLGSAWHSPLLATLGLVPWLAGGNN